MIPISSSSSSWIGAGSRFRALSVLRFRRFMSSLAHGVLRINTVFIVTGATVRIGSRPAPAGGYEFHPHPHRDNGHSWQQHPSVPAHELLSLCQAVLRIFKPRADPVIHTEVEGQRIQTLEFEVLSIIERTPTKFKALLNRSRD